MSLDTSRDAIPRLDMVCQVNGQSSGIEGAGSSCSRASEHGSRWSVSWGYPLISRTIGLMLLTAVCVKIVELTTGSLDSSRWIFIVQIEGEAVLAFWLLLGIYAKQARRAAIAAFALFAVVAFTKGINGEPSCGCVGTVQINPWLMLLIDLAALAALYHAQPSTVAESPDGLHTLSRKKARLLESAFVLAGLSLLIIGFSVHAWLQPDPGIFNRVGLEPASVEFGTANQGQSLTHTFRLHNGWSKAIELIKVSTDCACVTGSHLVGTVVQPDEVIDVPVTLRTGDADGSRSAFFTVYYRSVNEGARAWKTVRLSASVVTDYWVRPLLVDFGKVEGLKDINRRVRLRPHLLADVRVTGIETGNPALTVHQVQGARDETDLCFDIALSPTSVKEKTPISSFVRFQTNSERLPATTVLVTAILCPPVEIEPAAVVVGSDCVGAIQRQIRLSARQPARIGTVKCDEVDVVFRVPRETSSHHTVSIEIPPNPSGKGLSAQAQFHVEIPMGDGTAEACTVTLPIYRLPRN